MVRGLGIGSIPGVNRSSTEPCIPAPQDHAGRAPLMSRNRGIIAWAKRCWIRLCEILLANDPKTHCRGPGFHLTTVFPRLDRRIG